jgi:hypothetical protein
MMATVPREGVCVCGILVAHHYDATNRRISCDAAARVAEAIASVALSVSAAPLALLSPAPGLHLAYSSNRSVAR